MRGGRLQMVKRPLQMAKRTFALILPRACEKPASALSSTREEDSESWGESVQAHSVKRSSRNPARSTKSLLLPL